LPDWSHSSVSACEHDKTEKNLWTDFYERIGAVRHWTYQKNKYS